MHTLLFIRAHYLMRAMDLSQFIAASCIRWQIWGYALIAGM
jgi:hypothetical protein